MTSAYAQDISAGPVTVDTGSAWLDFGMVVALLVICTICAIVVKRFGR